MTKTTRHLHHQVPLIRAGALIPFVRWMYVNHRPLEARLEAADLSSLVFHAPDHPIAVFNAARFLREMERAEGPDIGCRVVTPTTVLEIGKLGRMAIGARTPRQALDRISAKMDLHCTHEHFLVTEEDNAVVIREFFTVDLDDETLHIEQQYVAAIVQSLCALATIDAPQLERIELVPHPEYGLDHLRPWFNTELVPSSTRGLVLSIPPDVADRRFSAVARGRRDDTPPMDWRPLSEDGSFTGTARIVVAEMLDNGSPTIGRLARAAGLSTRTLQRRLAQEGMTFSDLLEDVRQREALRLLKSPDVSIGEIAAAVGYQRQSNISRAVRRWTGMTPRSVRSSGSG